ncbi:hypothetical protein TKK_0008423 [Trichogramma kaykai]
MSEKMTWKSLEDTLVVPKVVAAASVTTQEKTMKIPDHNVDVTSLLKLNTNDAQEFFCGVGSALINVTVTYPVNKIIFRQILENISAAGAFRQLSKEGPRLLYRGMLPPLCQKTISLSLMFSIYEGCKERLYFLTNDRATASLCAAFFAGTVEAAFMPLERVQTLLQDWRYHNKFKNTPQAFSLLLRQYGLAECYRGLVPIIFRNGLSNIFFFSLRNQAMQYIDKENSMLANFMTGAVIGGITSTVFYPMNVIKIHMQSKIGGDFEKFTKCCKEVYISRDRKLSSFYKGVQLNFVRSFISWGVINASYYALKQLC